MTIINKGGPLSCVLSFDRMNDRSHHYKATASVNL